jgi:hypothetical protein
MLRRRVLSWWRRKRVICLSEARSCEGERWLGVVLERVVVVEVRVRIEEVEGDEDSVPESDDESESGSGSIGGVTVHVSFCFDESESLEDRSRITLVFGFGEGAGEGADGHFIGDFVAGSAGCGGGVGDNAGLETGVAGFGKRSDENDPGLIGSTTFGPSMTALVASNANKLSTTYPSPNSPARLISLCCSDSLL